MCSSDLKTLAIFFYFSSNYINSEHFNKTTYRMNMTMTTDDEVIINIQSPSCQFSAISRGFITQENPYNE